MRPFLRTKPRSRLRSSGPAIGREAITGQGQPKQTRPKHCKTNCGASSTPLGPRFYRLEHSSRCGTPSIPRSICTSLCMQRPPSSWRRCISSKAIDLICSSIVCTFAWRTNERKLSRHRKRCSKRPWTSADTLKRKWRADGNEIVILSGSVTGHGCGFGGFADRRAVPADARWFGCRQPGCHGLVA